MRRKIEGREEANVLDFETPHISDLALTSRFSQVPVPGQEPTTPEVVSRYAGFLNLAVFFQLVCILGPRLFLSLLLFLINGRSHWPDID